MKGWLLAIYPDYANDALVYWVRTWKGAHKVVERRFVPMIYAHGSESAMDDLEKALPILDAVGQVGREMKSTWLGEEPREVLSIGVRKYSRVEDVAHTVDNRGRYKDFSLFNVDLRFSQRFFAERDIFPMGLMEFRPMPIMLEDRFAFEYEKPPLKTTELGVSVAAKHGVPAFDDRLVSATVGAEEVDGDEERVAHARLQDPRAQVLPAARVARRGGDYEAFFDRKPDARMAAKLLAGAFGCRADLVQIQARGEERFVVGEFAPKSWDRP